MKVIILSIYDGLYNFTLMTIINGVVNKRYNDRDIAHELIKYRKKTNHSFEIGDFIELYPEYDLYILCQDGDCGVKLQNYDYIDFFKKPLKSPIEPIDTEENISEFMTWYAENKEEETDEN